MGANRTSNDLPRYQFTGYTIYLLEKDSQLANGIPIGIKSTLTAEFNIIKEMGDSVETRTHKPPYMKD